MKQTDSTKAKSILKSIGWTALHVVLQFATMVLFFLICVFGKGITEQELLSDWVTNSTFLMTITASALFVVVALLSYRAKKVSAKEEWKVLKSKPKSYVMPCFIAITYSLFYALITYNAVASSNSLMQASIKFYDAFGIPIMVLALLIAAPISEEILYRGIVMNILKKSFSARSAVLISSILFGVMHLSAGGFHLAVGAVAMGFVLAVIYEKTGSLCVAVLAHAIANLPDFLLSGSPVVSDTVRIALAILFLIISLVSLVLWWKKTAK